MAAGGNHKCRRICVWCIANSVAFPLEHAIWEKVPVLNLVPQLLGIH
jgi:hypothetical protein